MVRHLIIFSLLLSFSFSYSQKLNQHNKKGERIGRWITFTDSTKTKKVFDGRYKKGISKGKCFYYNADGSLQKKEITRFRRMRLTFYHPNGKIKEKGRARVENTNEKIHFYFYGKWEVYNPEGKLISYDYYKKGELIKKENLVKTNTAKDTVCKVLPQIENSFSTKNKVLLDTLALCWSSPALAEKYCVKIYKADSLSFKRIENCLNYYGHPTKDECPDAVNVPFFVFSHAPVAMREKYIEFFKAAFYSTS